METKPLLIQCENIETANGFDKENWQEYRLSEELSRNTNKFVFIRRKMPK